MNTIEPVNSLITNALIVNQIVDWNSVYTVCLFGVKDFFVDMHSTMKSANGKIN